MTLNDLFQHPAKSLLPVLLTSATVLAQPVQPRDSLPSNIQPDSVSVVSQPVFKASRVDTLLPSHRPSRSPGLALLFSAVVPGAGQVYNGSYWKVPIMFGLGYYFASRWVSNNNKYRDYRDQYAESLLSGSGNSRFFQLREFYRDQRDEFAWYFAILYFVNLVDAYVDASLYDFDVGPDLSIRLMAEPAMRMSLQVCF
jgi:hypothetical protein